MSATIAVACPECRKELKLPAELAGKKVRCKGCNATFPVQARAAPPARPKGILDDDDGPAHFGVKDAEKVAARCPYCATELPESAVICIHCGYNLRTRERLEPQRVVETTAADQMAWLMPAYACLVLILFLIGFNLFYLLKLEDLLRGGSFEWLTYRGFKVWVAVISLFIIFYAGRFAVRRLVFQPHPPEHGS